MQEHPHFAAAQLLFERAMDLTKDYRNPTMVAEVYLAQIAASLAIAEALHQVVEQMKSGVFVSRF